METLKHKLIIKGDIKVETGLHIGGSASNMEIGALDQNNIIKTADGVPFIPGSSLKGKLRNMLVKATGSPDVNDPKEKELDVSTIFGIGAKDNNGYSAALLRVRDANLIRESVEDMEMDFEYSEVKYENTIDRITGNAKPRPLERVPAGAVFNFEMIYDCFIEQKETEHLQAIAFAMEMLQYDSLGGSGTRGSGKIKFENIKTFKVNINTKAKTIETEETKEENIYSLFAKFNKKSKDEDSNH